MTNCTFGKRSGSAENKLSKHTVRSPIQLDHNNLEEFANPADYDAEYGAYEPEGPFYAALAHEVGGPILELACGTGRIAIPLAQQGFTVTGVDTDGGLVAWGQQKAAKLAADLPMTWVHADCRTVQLGRRFRLIYMTGHAFQAYLTRADLEALLARVRDHLAPDGRFAFETRNPRMVWLAEGTTEEEYWQTFRDSAGHEVRSSGTDWYDHVNQIQHYTTYRRWIDTDGTEQMSTTRIALRYVFPQEMEALLHYNGFAIERSYGDWDGSPITADSAEMIYVCRLAQ